MQENNIRNKPYTPKRDSTYKCMSNDFIAASRQLESFYDGILMCSVVSTVSALNVEEKKELEKEGEKRGALQKTRILNSVEEKLISEYLKTESPSILKDAETYSFEDYASGNICWAGPFPSIDDRIEIANELGVSTYTEALVILKEKEKMEKKDNLNAQKIERKIRKEKKSSELNTVMLKILESNQSEETELSEDELFDKEYEKFQLKKNKDVPWEPILESGFSSKGVTSKVFGFIGKIFGKKNKQQIKEESNHE